MKLVMNEKLKHRLVGVSVILSLGAIFLPAMMKKSSQRLEHNFSVNVQLPPKPTAPNVAVTDEEQLFKTIKVARVVDITPSKAEKTANANKDLIASAAVKAVGTSVAQLDSAPDSQVMPLEMALNEATKTAAKKEIAVVAAKKAVTRKPLIAQVIKKPVVRKDIYALQLASFSKLANAQALVSKLQAKGHKASYKRIASKNGPVYKVYVGHSPDKNNVIKLRAQLASAMQLNGFVVNTGVS
jgi:DedD protein